MSIFFFFLVIKVVAEVATLSFFIEGNSCEIENSIYFDAMHEMVRVLIFLYILQNNYQFLERFMATRFLCILQTQLVFWYFPILNLFYFMYASHDV